MSEMNRQLRVLFVDDEVTIRTNYTIALRSMFETVYEASDGEEALRLYQQYKPEIMIVDINLPKLNGLELLEKISQEHSPFTAVVMSAHTDIDTRLQEYNLDGMQYLVKPVSRKIFLKTLADITQQYTQNKEFSQERT